MAVAHSAVCLLICMDAVASIARSCGLFDTHCHLQTDFLYSRLRGVVENANKAGVRRMATAGCEVGDWQQTLDIAHQFQEQGVLAGLGIHPFTVTQPTFASSNWEELLTSRLELNKHVFVGEIGLDAGPQYKSYLPQQEVVLQKQLALAVRFDRPAIIHCVRAPEKLSAILELLGSNVEKSSPGGKSVRLGLHWYSGSPESMKRLLKLTSLEIYFSFTGASVQNERAQKGNKDMPFGSDPHRNRRERGSLCGHRAKPERACQLGARVCRSCRTSSRRPRSVSETALEELEFTLWFGPLNNFTTSFYVWYIVQKMDRNVFLSCTIARQRGVTALSLDTVFASHSLGYEI